jgi:hypothetical protein
MHLLKYNNNNNNKIGKNNTIKRLYAIKTVIELTIILLIDGIRNMQNIHSRN